MYDFHKQCASQIIAVHIIGMLDREAHIARLAAEQELADLLGYVMDCRVELDSRAPQICERCGFEMGFHSTDTGACPTANRKAGD